MVYESEPQESQMNTVNKIIYLSVQESVQQILDSWEETSQPSVIFFLADVLW